MENLTQETKKAISISRAFNLPLTTVWKAWSEAESLQKWFSPEGYTNPNASVDFKVGGRFFTSMISLEGQQTWGTGRYIEILPFKKIVYADSFADAEGDIVSGSYYSMPGDWDLELTVTVEFEEINGQTNLTILHENLPVEAADDCIDGWESCFDKLECTFTILEQD